MKISGPQDTAASWSPGNCAVGFREVENTSENLKKIHLFKVHELPFKTNFQTSVFL